MLTSCKSWSIPGRYFACYIVSPCAPVMAYTDSSSNKSEPLDYLDIVFTSIIDNCIYKWNLEIETIYM